MRLLALGLLVAWLASTGSCEDDSKYTTGGPTTSTTPGGAGGGGTGGTPDANGGPDASQD